MCIKLVGISKDLLTMSTSIKVGLLLAASLLQVVMSGQSKAYNDVPEITTFYWNKTKKIFYFLVAGIIIDILLFLLPTEHSAWGDLLIVALNIYVLWLSFSTIKWILGHDRHEFVLECVKESLSSKPTGINRILYVPLRILYVPLKKSQIWIEKKLQMMTSQSNQRPIQIAQHIYYQMIRGQINPKYIVNFEEMLLNLTKINIAKKSDSDKSSALESPDSSMEKKVISERNLNSNWVEWDQILELTTKLSDSSRFSELIYHLFELISVSNPNENIEIIKKYIFKGVMHAFKYRQFKMLVTTRQKIKEQYFKTTDNNFWVDIYNKIDNDEKALGSNALLFIFVELSLEGKPKMTLHSDTTNLKDTVNFWLSQNQMLDEIYFSEVEKVRDILNNLSTTYSEYSIWT